MSRSFDAVDDVLTVPHGSALDLNPYTVALWAKRTGAGEGDARVMNKGPGTSIAAYTINASDGNPTRMRARHANGSTGHHVAITDDDGFPASSWVCRFVTVEGYANGTGGLFIYEYDGVNVVESGYSTPNTGFGALIHNTNDLYIGNASDGSSTWAGLLAFIAIDGGLWDNAKMLSFAEGSLPADTDFFWRMDESGLSIPNSGVVEGYAASVSGAVLSSDNPPELYLPPPPTGMIMMESGGPIRLESSGAYLLDP